MNHNTFSTPKQILSDVLYAVDDLDFRKGLHEGWYIQQIRTALKELAFDTFFSKVTLDLKMDRDRLAIELPKGVFNIRELYVYNSACCGPESDFRVVHWKRLHNNKGLGDKASSRIRKSGDGYDSDPFLFNLNEYHNYVTGGRAIRYYAGVQNGLLMFSSECGSYEYVRIVFNGINGDISDKPMIPMFLEEAVKDFVKVKFFEVMKNQNPRKYRALWFDAKDEYENPRDGSKKQARIRVASMDTWEKESMEEYISQMYHK